MLRSRDQERQTQTRCCHPTELPVGVVLGADRAHRSGDTHTNPPPEGVGVPRAGLRPRTRHRCRPLSSRWAPTA
jgi:hypothetical protein